MNFEELLETLANLSKPTLFTLIGLALIVIAALRKIKAWDIDLDPINRILVGTLGVVLILVGLLPWPEETSPTIELPERIEIRISGSTTIVQYTERYKQEFQKKYPGAKVEYT